MQDMSLASSGHRLRPVAVAAGVQPGLGAALFSIREAGRVEISRPVRPDAHILCLAVQGATHNRYSADGKVCFDGVFRRGIGHIVRAGEQPGAILTDPEFSALHLHLPTGLMQRFAARMTEQPEALLLDGAFRKLDPDMERVAEAILREMQYPTPSAPLMIDSLVQQLMIHLLRHWSNLPQMAMLSAGVLPAWRLRRIEDFVRDHLGDPIELEDLAQLVGLSPGYFSHAFKATKGVSPYRWLVAQRVEHAKHLLSSCQEPLASIALACGFADQSHLTTVFRKHVGATPARYREACRL